MLFNSSLFIFVFLPITVAVYFALNHKQKRSAAKFWLVLASLFFYGYWNPLYLPLISASILINYGLGLRLRAHSKKAELIFGITLNVALLAYFKYTDFFLENLNHAFNTDIPLPEIILPLAISFFTFQQIAYLVDCYRAKTDEHNFLNYSLFVSFFPQLIAGPIVHHKQMMPQFAQLGQSNVHWDNIAKGLLIFSIGLFKKVFIADHFALWADSGYAQVDQLSSAEAWITSLCYTFQLYFDFSGYSDMAIGAALLFNIKLPMNFNSPYKAVSIQDFWRRWHITLSHFLRDYIYIPLGGNRKREIQTCNNILITFLIGGLWHGAGWTFVIWGALHGLALVIHRTWQGTGVKIPRLAAWALTFLFVNFAWIFFRADSPAQAINLIEKMLIPDIAHPSPSFSVLTNATDLGLYGLAMHLAFFAILAFRGRNSMQILSTQRHFHLGHSVFILVTLLYTYISGLNSHAAPFLYFNF
ncbi:MAG: MBOAT family protein [Pseudomonadales bacterium]|nr:MBOAT family protein [Pseudomonadales bacterium]